VGSSLALALFLSQACSSSSAPPAASTTNGVDDVAAACQIRASWTKGSDATCNTCIGVAIAPKCSCETESYAGECNGQQAAFDREPTCSGVSGCIGGCGRTDCGCIVGCYAGKPACKTLGDALDGCVAAACGGICG
jgi:hypothetical protein